MSLKSRVFFITEETYPLAVALLPSHFQDHPKDEVMDMVVIFHELPEDAPVDNQWMTLDDFHKTYSVTVHDVVIVEMFKIS